MKVSFFPRATNHHVDSEQEMSWEDFVSTVRHPEANTTPKSALRLWTPATYRNAYVEDVNVIDVHLLGFDVDEPPVPTEAEIRASVPWRAVAHTTASATAQAPRWRLFIALSRPVTPLEYRRLWMAIAGSKLGFRVGRQSKNPSRGWYVPRTGDDGAYYAFTIDGPPLAVDEVLTWAPPAQALPTGDTSTDVAFTEPESLPPKYHRKVSQVASALRDACPDVGANGGRHALSLKLAGALVSSELTWRVPDEHVPAFVYRACEEAGFGTLDQKWLNAIRTVALKRSGGAIAGWPSLRSEFPTVAAAVDPYYVEPLRGSAPAPPAAPPPASAPSALEADAPGFVGVPASALAAPLPRIEYIVRHFGIAKGRPTLLAGYGGLGKTIVAQALALHMAAGSGQCWGLPITSGPVWHFDYEMTLDPLQRRYQRLAYGYGLELKDCKLHVCSMPRIYLSDDEAEDALCRATDGLVLALVDNLAAATATSPHGENESNIRHYLDRLTRVTVRTGCQFLVLAHEKKGVQEGAHGLQKVRGSSAITDACGSVVSISVEPETGILTLAHNKASLREAGGDVCLKITDVDDRMRMPEDDPAGLRVERVDTVQRDVEAERRDRERDEAALERAKAEAVRVLREDPRGGLSRTQIQRLMRGDGKWKARAIELLVRDEVFIEAAGALSINR